MNVLSPFFFPSSLLSSISLSFPFFLHLILVFLPELVHTMYITLWLDLSTWNNHGHPAKSIEREVFEYLLWSLRWKSHQLFGHVSELLLIFYLASATASANLSPCIYGYNSVDQPALNHLASVALHPAWKMPCPLPRVTSCSPPTPL